MTALPRPPDPRHDARRQRLSEFVAWTRQHVTGDEKGQAQIFLDRLFHAFGRRGLLEVGGTPEFRIRQSLVRESLLAPSTAGIPFRDRPAGTAFADYVWKPLLLIEMKKRGEDLTRHYRQAYDYWVRLVPGRPRFELSLALAGRGRGEGANRFDEFWIYDFETQIDVPVDSRPLCPTPL